MKKLALIASLFGAFAVQSQCSDLFFSEYEEGSSSNKAFEIYNPTSSAVDLSDYVIYRANNGSLTATDSLFPVGMLLPDDVYVTGNPSANAAIMAQADTLHTLTFYNGDDAMWIEKISTGDTLDIIGIIGVDPGSGWPVGTGFTNNFTLIRMVGIQQGQLNWAIGATEWDVFPIDMTDSLGAHSMTSCIIATSCTEPFFSEYLEGSSSNKALEIYNPSGLPLDLNDYVIYRYNNGSLTATDSLFPNAIVAPGDVFMVTNPSATLPGITTNSDTVHTMCFFNGDDAISLINTVTSDTVDVIGQIGVDPGSGWVVGTGATNNTSLIRMSTVTQGTSSWPLGVTQWDVFPIDMADSIGAHTMVTCGTVTCSETSASLNLSQCDSYTSPSGNYTWTTSNTYMDTIPNVGGCDSVITIVLNITTSTNGTDVYTMCDSLMWMDGNTYYTDNNTATHTLTNLAGCDSLVTLDLTVNSSGTSTDVITACDSTIWLDGNTYYANNNTATFATITASGCDSIVTLELTINTVNTAVTNSSPTLTANAIGATYQWVDCNNGNADIPGETGQSFTATANGSYAVEVTKNGCTGTSACEDVTGLGIDEMSSLNATIYPNPTQGKFTIDLASTESSIHIRVMNINGQLVAQSHHSMTSSIDLELTIDAGIYFVDVVNADGISKRFKLMVK